MNRILLTGAALAVALVGSATAYAAGTTPVSTSTPAVNYGARCTTLADQWKTAQTTNATNANLGKAKGDAAKADKECKSKKAAEQKKGVGNYEAALKLLGVTPG